MDWTVNNLYFSGMADPQDPIPTFALYGERGLFPDIMQCERIADRARGLVWEIAPHRHGLLHQFVLVTEPGGRISVDGQVLPITGPTLISMPRFTVHGFRFLAGQRGYVLSVLPDTLPDLFGDRAEDPRALSRWRAVPAPDSIETVFEAVLSELAGAAALRNTLLKARATEIAAATLRAPDRAGTKTRPAPAIRHMRRFEEMVQSDPGARQSVADYAARIGISSEHLGRITKKMTGLSPARFVEARRMQEARRQLAYTRAPIVEIAGALGYDDAAYFSRAFRRIEGVSPRRYREARNGSASGPAS